jgi:hypothetical protein
MQVAAINSSNPIPSIRYQLDYRVYPQRIIRRQEWGTTFSYVQTVRICISISASGQLQFGRTSCHEQEDGKVTAGCEQE